MNQRMSPNDLRHPKSWKKNERHSNIWIAFRSDLSLKNGKHMSRDPRYQRLLNDKRWKLLRAEVFRRAGGLCELCKAEGFITPGVDVHHIKPVETGRTVQEMERLAYNPNNCQLLCVACHIKVHQDMRTHTKEKVKENKERARRRFLEMNDPNYEPPTD